MYFSYRQRLDGLTKLRSDVHLVLMTLNREESDLTIDLKFISECKLVLNVRVCSLILRLIWHCTCTCTLALKIANDEYALKLSAGTSMEKTLYSLGWKVDELSRLQKVGRALFVELSSLKDILVDMNVDTITLNIPQKLKENLAPFDKGMY